MVVLVTLMKTTTPLKPKSADLPPEPRDINLCDAVVREDGQAVGVQADAVLDLGLDVVLEQED